MSYILKALRRAEAERAKGSIPGLSARHAPEPESGRRLWPWLLVGAMAINAAIIIFAIWPSGMLSGKNDGDFGILSRSADERPAVLVPDWQRSDQLAAGTAPQAANGAAARPVPGQAQAATDPRLFDAADGVNGNPALPGGSDVAARLPGGRGAAPEPVDWMNEPPSKPAGGAQSEATPSLGLAESDSLPLPQSKPLTVAARTLLQEDFGQEPLDDLSGAPFGAEEDFLDEDFRDEEIEFARELEEEQARLARLEPSAAPAGSAEPPRRPNPYADVPVFWQMPHDFRAKVPSMKLAVHVFSPENAGRFVIIDRRRYREGDQVSEGMMLEAILPNGVVFDYLGQRFRMEHQ